MYITNTSGCTSGGSWEAYSSSKASWTIAQTNATATVYVKFRDSLHNESSCESDTIIHDSNPPYSLSILIDSGASHTHTTSVSLSIGATDASQMWVSNNSDFSTGSWETYNVVNLGL